MFKTIWDALSTLVLFFVFFWTPWRIAFTEDTVLSYLVIDEVVDFIFLIDMILTCFTAYYNAKFILIDKWRTIFFNYLISWFIIDLVSIIPFNMIISPTNFSEPSANKATRLSKVSKLYKLLWITRLFWLLKGAKNRAKYERYLNKFLKIGVALERLVYFAVIFILLIHVFTFLFSCYRSDTSLYAT